jgi:hypothetical protein
MRKSSIILLAINISLKDFICTTCAEGKLITRPSLLKIMDESQNGLVESLIKRIK